MVDILFHGISVGKFRVDTLSSSQFPILLSLCTRLARRFLVRNRLDFIVMPQKAKIGTIKSRIWNNVIILFGNQKSKSNQYGMIYDWYIDLTKVYVMSDYSFARYSLNCCTNSVYIALYGDAMLMATRWATIGRSRSNSNIRQWVLLLNRKVINPDTLNIILLQA